MDSQIDEKRIGLIGEGYERKIELFRAFQLGEDLHKIKLAVKDYRKPIINTEEFVIKIDNNKDYKYDLYSSMEEDLNDFISSKEDELFLKENELNNLEELLIEEKNNLINLKNELLEKENKLNDEKVLLNQERENLEKLKQAINIDHLNINKKTEELIIKEQELNKLKSDLNIFSNTLDIKETDLIKLELDISEREYKLKKYNEELNLLNNELIEKKNKLSYLEENIKNKELELEKREESIIELKKKKEEENILVVEVPNTYKKNYNKLISKIMIFIGIILIILSKRKVTSH